jgi:50S ribosome-binding GTPase
VAAPTARRLDAVASELMSPLTVAVAGRVKAGKSTLVNALLGRAIAPTGVTECTQLVTSFRRGAADQLSARMTDGTSVELRMDRGRLPDPLGLPLESIRYLEARLASDALDQMVLVDTPGLSTLRSENAERTAAFLGLDLDQHSAEFCARADAVIFVTSHVAYDDEAEALRQFVAATGQRSPVATLAVLGQADRAGDQATRLADDQASALRGLVSDVVPVCGLLAQAFRCGLFTESDADTVRAIAAVPDEDREWLLEDLVSFTELPTGGATPMARRRLIDLLDLPGVRLAVSASRAGAQHAHGLEQVLLAQSNYPAVERRLAVFGQRADALKVSRSVAMIEAIAYSGHTSAADRLQLTSLVASLRTAPELHCLAEFGALDEVLRCAIAASPAEVEELSRLFTQAPPNVRLGLDADCSVNEITDTARKHAVRWQAVRATDRVPRRRHLAQVAARSYRLITQVAAQPPTEPAAVSQ